RKIGTHHPEPMVADMEKRLLDAVNKTGFGPMGTGGDTTALAVHIDYSHGHGFVPVAVCFNCWINRRTAARIHHDNRVERLAWASSPGPSAPHPAVGARAGAQPQARRHGAA